MERTILMTPAAQQALWSKLSNDQVFIPTHFTIDGDCKEGYRIEKLDKNDCGFIVVENITYLSTAKNIIAEINNTGNTICTKCTVGTFAWRNYPMPVTTPTKSPISGIESTGVTRTCIVKNLITGEELTFVNQASLTDNVINAIISNTKLSSALLDQAQRETVSQLYPIKEGTSTITGRQFAYCQERHLHARYTN